MFAWKGGGGVFVGPEEKIRKALEWFYPKYGWQKAKRGDELDGVYSDVLDGC